MDYSRANFAHNFLNAVETDHSVAWDIFANEINEIIHTNPAAAAETLNSVGIRAGINPSKERLSYLIFENVYQKPELQKALTKLIYLRHKSDEFITSIGGKYDQVYNNAAGNASESTDADDELQVKEVQNGIARIAGTDETKEGLQVKKEMARGIMRDNMNAKTRYYSMISGKIRIHPVIVIAGGIGIGALIVYGIHLWMSKPNK